MTEAIPSSKAKNQTVNMWIRAFVYWVLGTNSVYIWNYLSSNREQEMKKFTFLLGICGIVEDSIWHKPNKKGLPRKQKCKRSNPNESQMWFLVDDSLHSYLQLFFITRTFAYKLFFVSFTLSVCYYVSPVSGLQFAVCIHYSIWICIEYASIPNDTILIWFRTVVVFFPILYWTFCMYAGDEK